MNEQPHRYESRNWETMTPPQVLEALIYDLYNPVSLIGSHLNRLTGDEDPLTEEEYEVIFEQMQVAVRHLSKVVVNLRRYLQDHESAQPLDE